ncbi:MAG: hypothetical protein AB2L09_11040 [Coriobacteriia bacterium]
MGETDVSRLEGNPDLFVRIAENALTVAEELRKDYFGSTLGLARSMRDALVKGDSGYRVTKVPASPQDPCTAVFVDGGLSQIDLGIGIPLIVRAGIFRVKQGERDMEKRETFDHFPLMLGQLKGGLKANSRYGDVVRLIVELGALVTALEDERFSDARLLMLHGPLQFVAGPYFEHWFYLEDFAQMLGADADRPHVRPLPPGLPRMVLVVPSPWQLALQAGHPVTTHACRLHDGVPSGLHLQTRRRERRPALWRRRAVVWPKHHSAHGEAHAGTRAGGALGNGRDPATRLG